MEGAQPPSDSGGRGDGTPRIELRLGSERGGTSRYQESDKRLDIQQ